MECNEARERERPRPARPPPPVVRSRDFRAVQRSHDEAYRLINKGLVADEEGKIQESMSFYQQGLNEITTLLEIDCERIQGTPDEIDLAKQMLQKATKTKLQTEYRLKALQAQQATNVHVLPEYIEMENDRPPSYEESMSSPSSVSGDRTFDSLGDSIMTDEQDHANSQVANASEVFSIPDGVQIFYITPEGYVSAPSYPTFLRILSFDEETRNETANQQRPPAFLQVGDWYYPMIPGTSPVLHASYGAYIFPDMTTSQQGSAVGLILPETASPEQKQCFETVLRSMTAMREQESVITPEESAATAPPMEVMDEGATASLPTATKQLHEEPEVVRGEQEEEATSTKISKGISVAAEYISWGVGKGAEKAGQWIRLGSAKLQARLRPEDQARPVDPRIQKGIQYARKGTHVAVQVSSYVVSKLGQATMALAREVAPHIRKQGEKLLPKSMTQPSNGKSKIDGVVEVAASGLKGFGTVYMGLEQAAKALAKNVALETAHVVDHKYGPAAGQATENALFAAGNIAMTTYNANHLGVKAIAKRAAKDTGKAVLDDLQEARKPKDLQ